MAWVVRTAAGLTRVTIIVPAAVGLFYGVHRHYATARTRLADLSRCRLCRADTLDVFVVVTRRDDVARSVGAYGTSWYAGPREDMTGILMTQRVWDSPVAPGVNRDFWASAYQAIDD